jgi:hypothetical protein
MTTLRRRWLLIIITMAITATILAALFRPFGQTNGFYVPNALEARAAQRIFANLLLPGKFDTDDANRIGFLAKPIDGGLALVEAAQDCKGRGGYVVRGGNRTLPVAITAPHRGSDRHSGTIAQLLFAEHPIAAVAWNSAPRRAGQQCPHGGDIAQMPTHYFTAFSAAFAQKNPSGRVVQLHGFDQAKRKSAAAQQADMIISDGSKKPSARLLDFADCLTRSFPEFTIAVFPIDTDELGATTNAQGKALRRQNHAGFTHVEMDAALRVAMVNDAAMRARFARCLAA